MWWTTITGDGRRVDNEGNRLSDILFETAYEIRNFTNAKTRS